MKLNSLFTTLIYSYSSIQISNSLIRNVNINQRSLINRSFMLENNENNRNPSFFDERHSKMILQKAKVIFASTLVALSTCMSYTEAAPVPVSNARLEETIISLENAENKADVLQGLADLFEAADKKTLLVRTKYKYVCYASYIHLPIIKINFI